MWNCVPSKEHNCITPPLPITSLPFCVIRLRWLNGVVPYITPHAAVTPVWYMLFICLELSTLGLFYWTVAFGSSTNFIFLWLDALFSLLFFAWLLGFFYIFWEVGYNLFIYSTARLWKKVNQVRKLYPKKSALVQPARRLQMPATRLCRGTGSPGPSTRHRRRWFVKVLWKGSLNRNCRQRLHFKNS